MDYLKLEVGVFTPSSSRRGVAERRCAGADCRGPVPSADADSRSSDRFRRHARGHRRSHSRPVRNRGQFTIQTDAASPLWTGTWLEASTRGRFVHEGPAAAFCSPLALPLRRRSRVPSARERCPLRAPSVPLRQGRGQGVRRVRWERWRRSNSCPAWRGGGDVVTVGRGQRTRTWSVEGDAATRRSAAGLTAGCCGNRASERTPSGALAARSDGYIELDIPSRTDQSLYPEILRPFI